MCLIPYSKENTHTRQPSFASDRPCASLLANAIDGDSNKAGHTRE